jgi:hypothetical protein
MIKPVGLFRHSESNFLRLNVLISFICMDWGRSRDLLPPLPKVWRGWNDSDKSEHIHHYPRRDLNPVADESNLNHRTSNSTLRLVPCLLQTLSWICESEICHCHTGFAIRHGERNLRWRFVALWSTTHFTLAHTVSGCVVGSCINLLKITRVLLGGKFHSAVTTVERQRRDAVFKSQQFTSGGRHSPGRC